MSKCLFFVACNDVYKISAALDTNCLPEIQTRKQTKKNVLINLIYFICPPIFHAYYKSRLLCLDGLFREEKWLLIDRKW